MEPLNIMGDWYQIERDPSLKPPVVEIWSFAEKNDFDVKSKSKCALLLKKNTWWDRETCAFAILMGDMGEIIDSTFTAHAAAIGSVGLGDLIRILTTGVKVGPSYSKIVLHIATSNWKRRTTSLTSYLAY